MQKTKIDWADMTWNPVTGCLHGCEYCYARKIAERFAGGGYGRMGGMFVAPYKADAFKPPYDLHEQQIARTKNDWYRDAPYPFGFEPTFHRYRLTEPTQIKKPQTIFVCSMADLFGKWVPDEWIQAVFKACETAPQHRYLFLTKNPKRYGEIRTNKARAISVSRVLRNKIWLGATVTSQSQYYEAASALEDADQTVYTFLSIEPILEPIAVTEIDCISNWIIIGAETGNRKGKVVPEKRWIDNIVSDCRISGVPVFMKESLRELMGADFIQQFPWEV
jgi:protein gp37